MIQRIQTLFWLVASALLAVPLGADYATITQGGVVSPLGIFASAWQPMALGASAWLAAAAIPVPILTVLCLALNGVSIFLYRRTKWQIRLSIWAIILQVILTLLLWLVPYGIARLNDGLYMVNIPFFMPLLATSATYLALQRVLRDRNFLRRMDRLR